MCGIAAVSLNPDDTKMDVGRISAALLAGIASRGPDATGAAWYDMDKDAVMLTKIPVPVAKFLEARKEILPVTTPTMILHTRMGTHGSKANRLNNHPIRHGNIIGVHNGVLWNHGEIFKSLGAKNLGDCDSEAIMALLSGGADPTEVLSDIAGDAAVAWINLDDPDDLHIARVVDRPVHISQTEEGSLVMASTKEAVASALKDSGLTAVYSFEMEEAKYMRVRGGVILEYLEIPDVQQDNAWTQRWSYTSGTTDYKPGRFQPKVVNTSPAKVEPGEADAIFLEQKAAFTADWYASKTIEELVDFATGGNAAAVAELHHRGRSASGVYVVMPRQLALEPVRIKV